jgi:magnesium-transporting ATPase (P-type)
MATSALADALGDPALADVDAVAHAFDTDPATGLTSAEASRRLALDGPNALRATPPTRWWRRLVAQLHDPLVYLLLLAMAVSLAAWAYEGAAGWPVDAIVIAVVITLNAALAYAQEAKAQSAVAALARMTEVTAAVRRDGALRRIASRELVRGDLLVLGEGDAVGADARLVEATSLRVQEASLTGESEAVLKDAATLRVASALGDRCDMVFKGTAVVQGSGRAIVTATGMRTEMGAIAAMLDATAQAPTPLQKEVARIGRRLGVAVVVIALVVVATVLALSEIRSAADVVAVLLLGVALAVAAVPEGLPAILSVVLAVGVQRMARQNAIVKTLSSVETLGSASVICSDKTGTLTRSEMTIERTMTASGATRVTGVGYAPLGRVEHEGDALTSGPLHAEHVVLLSGGSLASNADLRQGPGGAWEIQGDPTEAAFLVAERKLGATARRRRRFERVREIPFSSDRKMMSTIERDHEQDDALVVVTKGAPDVLIGRCSRVRVGLEVLPFDDEARARAFADVNRLLDDALRTLAVAYRPLAPGEETLGADALERELVFVGTVGIIDAPRAEAAVAIREARRAGIRVVMITGDHPRTAARIAADLGIVASGAKALSGDAIHALDPRRLRSSRAQDVGVCARGPCAQATHRRRAACRRPRRGDDRRRRQRRASTEGRRHRRRDGGRRHRGRQGSGRHGARRRQLRDHRRRGARRPLDLRQHPQVPALPAVVEHRRSADGVPGRDRRRRARPHRRRRHGRAAAPRDADPLDQPRHRLGPGAGDGRRSRDRRRDGTAAAPARRRRD